MKKRITVVLLLAVLVSMGIGFSLLAVAGSTHLTPYGIEFPDSTYQITGWDPCNTGIYYNGGNVGIGETEPDTRLHVSDSGNGNVVTIEKGGLGLVMQAFDPGFFSLIGWGPGGYNDLAIRANAESTGVYIRTSGKVGIGTKSPEATLDVNGDLIVRGNISFPRPAFNSGWQSISQGNILELIHNLGGDPDDYVVDLTFKDNSTYGIHHISYGGDHSDSGMSGAFWFDLDNNMIRVERGSEDAFCDSVRVRIWTH